jgi:hypothetical protein
MERNSEIFSDSPYRNVLKETKIKVRSKQSEKYTKVKEEKDVPSYRHQEARVL